MERNVRARGVVEDDRFEMGEGVAMIAGKQGGWGGGDGHMGWYTTCGEKDGWGMCVEFTDAPGGCGRAIATKEEGYTKPAEGSVKSGGQEGK